MKKSRFLLPLSILWIAGAGLFTVHQFRGISHTPQFLCAFLLLTLAPLIPGWVARLLRPWLPTGFYARNRGWFTEIHLTPWANARCRHARNVAMLKKQLNDCVTDALVQGRVVTMRSHLLTPRRVDEILRHLQQQGHLVNTVLEECPTPVRERRLLILIYLMADHRFIPVSHTSMTLTLTPVRSLCR